MSGIVRGGEIRFRPIIVSAIVAVVGFIPAAISQSIGAEIQRPLAQVVIGGLISSTAPTLLVLPAVHAFSRCASLSRTANPPPGNRTSAGKTPAQRARRLGPLGTPE